MSGAKRASENPIAMRLHTIKTKDDSYERNSLIEDYIPFIIGVLSKQLNRYIETDNSEEFSIGLIAFNEAIDKYNFSRGSFLNFAELVIRNRIKDNIRKKQKEQREIFIEDCQETNLASFSDFSGQIDEDAISLREEIRFYEMELAKFKITFEDLVDETPRHSDTKKNAIRISEQISQDQPIVEEMYAKKRLPISKVALKCQTTNKVIKGNRKFIISIVVIFTGKFSQLRSWVKNSLQGEKNE